MEDVTFRPHVFASGSYTLHVSDPDRGVSRTYRNLQATETKAAFRERLLGHR